MPSFLAMQDWTAKVHCMQHTVRTVTSKMYLVTTRFLHVACQNWCSSPRTLYGPVHCLQFIYLLQWYPHSHSIFLHKNQMCLLPRHPPYTPTQLWLDVLVLGLARVWAFNFCALDFISWWPVVLKLSLWAPGVFKGTGVKVLILEAATVALKRET